MDIRKLFGCGWTLSVALALGASAHASRLYSFSGKVSRVTDDSVEVTHGAVSREFSLSGMNDQEKNEFEPGQDVTLWYSMQVQKVSRSQPGRAGSNLKEPNLKNGNPDSASPRAFPPPIQDDRAFYNAKNEAPATGESPAS